MSIAPSFALYAATAVVFCAMAGLGTLPARVIGSACQPPRFFRLALAVASGWGIVALVSAACAIGGADQAWVARGLLAVGLVMLVPWRRGGRWQQTEMPGDLALVLVAAAPMGLLIADAPATAYDEFAQWLPNARQLVEHGHYWFGTDWQDASVRPGYPNASLIVSLLVSQFAGPQVEAPLKILVAILLALFGTVLGELAAARWRAATASSWAGCALVIALSSGGCLIAFLEPFADPRIAYTALTDTPTGILLAFLVLSAAFAVRNAREGHDASGWFAWAGLVSLALVLLRQTNVVLVAATMLGCALLIPWPTVSRWRCWLTAMLLFGVPPAIGAVAWEAYLRVARIGLPLVPHPFSQWDWSAPITVLKALLFDRVVAHPVLAGVAIAAVALCLGGAAILYRRPGATADDCLPQQSLLWSIVGVVAFCFLALVMWNYIAVAGPAEIAGATGLWRYITELGPAAVLAGCCTLLAPLTERRLAAPMVLAVAGLGIAGLLLLPVLGRAYLRPDCHYPDVVMARETGAELRPRLDPFGSRVGVAHPAMADWLAFALAYDFRWPLSQSFVKARSTSAALLDAERWAWDQGLAALLDFHPLDRLSRQPGATAPSVSLLGRPASRGEPWPLIATAHPRPLSCAAW